MKRLITLLLLVAFTTAVVPVNAFGPTPGQLEYQNNGNSPPFNHYGSFSNTPQQNWGETRPDGTFSIPESQCTHWQIQKVHINQWYEEYNDNEHIRYDELEERCVYCEKVFNSYTEENYSKHSFNSWNECTKCGYTTECNHSSTSRKTYIDYFEVYDTYYHTEIYRVEKVCRDCGEVLDSDRETRKNYHYFQYGRCWTCGYVQQTTPQQQYTPPIVSQPEYVEPEPKVEETVYQETAQQEAVQSSNLLPYQEALEQGRVYASTDDGLHLYKRNYAPNDYRGYEDKYYHTVKTRYDNFTLPPGEVFAQKGDYLYRHSDNGGGIVAASPSIIKTCDYRINELKNTLQGASDASTRISQYKQVKRGQMPLSNIAEQNKSYIAKTGSVNSKVSEIQTKLRDLGYTSQTRTGKLDSTTLNNIAYFQSQNGIYMTGWLDNETYNAIMSYGTNNNYVDTSNNNYSSNQMPSITLTSLADGIQVEKGIIPVQVVGNEYTTRIDVLVYDKEGFLCKTEEYTSNLNWDMRLVDTGEYDLTILAINNYTGAYVEKNITIKVIDNSSAGGTVTQFTLGVWDAVTSTGEGLWQIVSHPVQTVISLPSAIAYMVKAVVPGTEENLIVGTIALQVMAEMEENTFQENARYVGRITGEILIALLVSKGIDKGMEAVKSSAQTGKIGKIISLVAKGEDSADNVASLLRNGGKLFADNGQVTYASIVANASEFAGKSADDIANMLRNAGYKSVSIEASTKGSESLAKRVVVHSADKTHNIQQILVSPGSSRHGWVPYVKISTNDIGIIKVVNGSPSQYISAGEVGRTVIFLKP